MRTTTTTDLNDLRTGAAPPAWRVRQHDPFAVERLAREAAVPPVIAHLLLCRGIETAEDAKAHLHPSLLQLHDPYRMLGMKTAVVRLQRAVRDGEPILIYGDYDVDGTIATVLLKTALERIAPKDRPADVRYHIPHRIREGYGMQESVLASAAESGIRLVVSVDTGMRAFAAAKEAEALGLDLIVTDHHLPDDAEGVPRAVAVLNPNQSGCEYPCKSLCGAGVAFKLAQALLEAAAVTEEDRERLRAKTLPSFLKLLSIATIADCVPLTDENRVIVAIGLRELRRPAQAGLQALMDLAGLDRSRPLTATDVAFRVAPRINAAGRMDVASDVVDLFLTRDVLVGRTLAEKLHGLNEDRRATEAVALAAIEQRIAAMRESVDGLAACLVLDDPAWHRGVIGILASRVVERTGRPALVLSHEDGQAYGSGRSVAGFHLLEALTAVDMEGDTTVAGRLFTRFGGHAHAVGFSLPSERVEELRARMHRRALSLNFGDTPPVECEAVLPLRELTDEFAGWLERFGPFGIGNPEPLFLASGLRLASPVRLLKQTHIRLALEDPETERRYQAVGWGRGTSWSDQVQRMGLQRGALVDVAFRVRRNLHPDFGGLELEIAALRLAAN